MKKRKKASYKPINPAIADAAERFNRDPQAVLEVLRLIQEREGRLSQSAINDVARALRIPGERAYGVASFYSMLAIDETHPAEEEGGVIRVCDGPVCWLHGADRVRRTAGQAHGEEPGWLVERSSCLGLCDLAPAALVNQRQVGPLNAGIAEEAPQQWPGGPGIHARPRPGEKRVMMAHAGEIDPDSIESALEHDAYCGLGNALQRSPEEVLAEVEASGLTGRGGAGFPVGRKWRFVATAKAKPRYVVCNADESEPLIFKDRVLIDSNPHQVLEGMAIAGYAVGAEHAFIYIRGEYEPQAQRLERAVRQAEELGWLGENIQESGFSFHIHVHRGAGAYICGEETALLESLEGKRGEPRLRPPYPPSYGYLGYPTLVNNVESYAAVPPIICNGGEWYRSLSGFRTAGTKMYMVLGHVNNPGLFEAPFGLTLRQIIEDFGGGMQPGSEFQFALCGGAAGTVAAGPQLDIPIDYASAREGVSLGAGSFLICDQTVSPVGLLRNLLHFFTVESCGKCTPCRQGTRRSLEILDRVLEGKGTDESLQELLALADVMQVASFCGLGQSVALPVRSTVAHFRAEFLNETT